MLGYYVPNILFSHILCHLVLVNRYFASSKLCSNCGYKNTYLELNDREWICPECKSYHDLMRILIQIKGDCPNNIVIIKFSNNVLDIKKKDIDIIEFNKDCKWCDNRTGTYCRIHMVYLNRVLQCRKWPNFDNDLIDEEGAIEDAKIDDGFIKFL